ncbi:Hypothetical protein A7982_08732 [Minicystis rosea]|nr:Hypothetical protein A7982_08732 [Minicystis rosea]
MSFQHYLTMGYLAPINIRGRHVVVLRPLDPDIVMPLVEQFADVAGAPELKFGGMPVDLQGGVVRCALYNPGLIRSVVELALKLQEATRCVVADVEHGREFDAPHLRGWLREHEMRNDEEEGEGPESA